MFKEIMLISLPVYVEPIGFAKVYKYKYMLFLGSTDTRKFYISHHVEFTA